MFTHEEIKILHQMFTHEEKPIKNVIKCVPHKTHEYQLFMTYKSGLKLVKSLTKKRGKISKKRSPHGNILLTR